MSKIKQFLSNHYAMLYFILITAVLLLACFTEIAVYILLAIVIIGSVFLDEEKLIGAILYLSSFYRLITTSKNNSRDYFVLNFINLYLTFLLGVRYLINVFKKRTKIDWKILIPMLVMIVYLCLPMHNITFNTAVIYSVNLALIYLVFVNRKKYNFVFLLRIFCLSLNVSCFMGLLRYIIPYLNDMLPYVTVERYIRFTGLLEHPNLLGSHVVMAIACLYTAKLLKKIGTIEFLLMFVPLFCFGYCTISRNFIITFGIMTVIFAVLWIVRTKKQFWKFLLTVSVVLVAICGCCIIETKIYLVRFEILPESTIQEYKENSDVGESVNEHPDDEQYDIIEEYSDEFWKQVYNGNINYDPGRAELIKIYFNDWKSSVTTIMFGRGISQPLIGKMAAHNYLLQNLWRHGVIGMLLILMIVLSMINWKNVKHARRNIKTYYAMLVLLLTWLIAGLVEADPFGMLIYLFMIMGAQMCWNKQNYVRSSKIVIVSGGILPVPATKGGAVENLEQMILDENERQSKASFDMLSIYEENARREARNYHNTSFVFIKTNWFIKFLDKCSAFVAGKILHKRNMTKYKMPFQRIYYTYKVGKILERNNYDKVIYQNSTLSLWSIKYHDNSEKYKDRYDIHLHNEISGFYGCKQEVKNCHKILCVSQFVAESTAKKLDIIPSNQFEVVKNTINSTKFDGKITDEERRNLLKKYNIPSDRKIIIFTGRLTKEKGIDVLLRALQKVESKNYVLLIVGGYFFDTKIKTDYELELEQLTVGLKDNVVFTGFVKYDELPKVYALADFAVLPSMWDEPAGLTMIEALSSNLPLITTDSGGIKEYVGGYAYLLQRNLLLENNIAKGIDYLLNEENLKSVKLKINKFRCETLQEFYLDFMKKI